MPISKSNKMFRKRQKGGDIFDIAIFIALIFCFTGSEVKAAEVYHLGQGYDIGSFNLAGYSNVTAAFPAGKRDSLAVEDLSLFVTGHLSRWVNPFVEAELTHVTLARTSGDGDRDPGASLAIERLYNDAYLTNDLTLRLGKMLAPVGEWNLYHAAPLVLSTTRPAVTYRNFAAYIEGASLLYHDTNEIYPDVQVYWQPDYEESERPRDVRFQQHKMTTGIHIAFPLTPIDTLGVSIQRTTDLQGVSQTLIGGDFSYSLERFTFRGEATYSRLGAGGSPLVHDSETGMYVSASYAVTHSWSAYTWYESFQDRNATSLAQDVLIGMAYRPIDPVVFKLEYLENFGGTPVNPTGLFASWSVLF